MANIKIQLGQFFMEVSGSEEFVQNQYNELEEKYHLYDKIEKCNSGKPGHEDEDYSGNSDDPTCEGDDLKGLFSIGEDGVVNVNMSVPGNNKAERIKSLVFLIGYAKKNEWVPFAIIADECKRQGCWDQKNFASYIKQLGSNVMISGKGKSKSVRLTTLGLETAKDKIEVMFREG